MITETKQTTTKAFVYRNCLSQLSINAADIAKAKTVNQFSDYFHHWKVPIQESVSHQKYMP